MKIIQITPGTANTFYCDNCLRDISLVRALHNQGHEVLMMPMYLPVSLGGSEVSDTPIFFGGINVYLQQKWRIFRGTPRWIDWLFDRPGLLNWLGRKSDMTSAKDLGRMTVSMLRGRHGQQAKELNRLVEWLGAKENTPDVVILSNALLAGLAGAIRERAGATVVCLLQDEDGFLDGLGEPYSQQAWELLSELTSDIDAFVAVSRYYADVMRKRLGIEREQIRILHTGIDVQVFDSVQARPQTPTIGFLSRMCANKGLDTLVETFVKLKQNDRLKDARLKIAGGKNRSDEELISRIQGQLETCGFAGDVEFISSFDCDTKLNFLGQLSVLSVPEKQPAAYSLYALEAMAAGVPVVEPATGVFPELSEMTGGLVLYEPNDADGLASALEQVLLDADYGRQVGAQGRKAVYEKLNVKQTARELVRICEGAVQRFQRGPSCSN
ncbi:MAG: glycosyltransferase family 4 protein [Planctomycetota bacterium]|jgi:glycosyltransferase involved in cell wall biosynthesis